MAKRTFKVWVQFGRLKGFPGGFYYRLDGDKPNEWRGWERATLTLSPPKKRRRK